MQRASQGWSWGCGLEQDRMAQVQQVLAVQHRAADCLKPDTKLHPGKSDRCGLSQSLVLWPTGMRGCLWPAHDKPFPCPKDGQRGSHTVPATCCCSP